MHQLIDTLKMKKINENQTDTLIKLFDATDQLELAVLIGSQAKGTATANSDWDIAIRWERSVDKYDQLVKTEVLRKKIANAINVHVDQIDIIDIANARLAMRSVIAEEGIVLKGENTLIWTHFLTHTWAELEDYYWRKSHAA